MKLKELFLASKGYIPLDNNGAWLYRKNPIFSIKKAAKLFNDIKGSNIIEIGSGLQGKMSGNSMYYWSKLTNAKSIIAIDMDKKELESLTPLLSKYKSIKAMQVNGVEYLKTYNEKISLLYLDFWSPDNKSEIIGTNRAKDYLNAYLNAKDKFNNQAIILIDDSDHVAPWKHSLIIPEARKDGFFVKWTGRQTLLFKPE